jgi:hypothetical protein
MPFKGDVVVREIGVTTWVLVEPLEYDGRDESFAVPVGTETDFASVPRPLVWLIPRYGTYTKCAILHDYLCHGKVVSARDADGIFRRSMNELQVPLLRRWMMWAAVRLGSRLRGATIGDFLIWLLVTVPSLAFVVVPFVVTLLWLGLFWLAEGAVYLALRPSRGKGLHKPELTVRLS